jgi:hypothetical protein
MFEIERNAMVKAITPRREFYGEEFFPAITIKLLFEAVPADLVAESLVSNFETIYHENDLVLSDVKTFDVLRRIENVEFSIGGKSLASTDVEKIRVTPVSGRTATVELCVKGRCSPSFTGLMHEFLHETVPVGLTQRQLELDVNTERRTA